MHPAVLKFLKSFLSAGSSPETKRIPWCCPACYDKFLPIIDNILGQSERTRNGDPQQYETSNRSVVYRIPTNQGTVYFKAVLEGSTEVAQTLCIGELFPDASPTIIGDAGGLNAFISADFGPTVSKLFFDVRLVDGKLRGEYDAHVARLILQQWAHMQQGSIPHCEVLMSAGVPVYDAAWIRKGFEELWTLLKHHKSISSELAINIAERKAPGGDFVFFDWEYAFIGHLIQERFMVSRMLDEIRRHTDDSEDRSVHNTAQPSRNRSRRPEEHQCDWK